MSGIRFSIRDGERELAHVQTETVDDFHYFRDSLHAALEPGGFGSRFPTFMKRWEPAEWAVEELDVLQEELEAVAGALRRLPPEPPDCNWRGKLAGSGRRCASLFEVFLDARGRPLVGRLIDLCVAAKKAGRPITLDDSEDVGGPEPPPSGRWTTGDAGPAGGGGGFHAFLNDTAETLAKVMAARERSDAAAPVPAPLAGGAAPGPVACLGCGRELGPALRPAIAVVVDGAEHLIAYRPCGSCGDVTIAVHRTPDGRSRRRGPIPREQAEAHQEMPPYCETPGDAACACESHRFFTFLYFKYGWGGE